LPVVLTSPVGGLSVSDLGVPLVSSFVGAVAGMVLPNMADVRQPGFNFLGLSAGDWVAIIAFIGALGIASYATDPTVKTVAVLAGSTALVVRAVQRVATALARTSAVSATPVTTPVKQVEFSVAPPPPAEMPPIVIAAPSTVSRPETVVSRVSAEDIALLHR
jgi:hypothetical protein